MLSQTKVYGENFNIHSICTGKETFKDCLCVLIQDAVSHLYLISVFAPDLSDSKTVISDLPADSNYSFSDNVLVMYRPDVDNRSIRGNEI